MNDIGKNTPPSSEEAVKQTEDKRKKRRTSKRKLSAGKMFLIIILVLALALAAVMFVPPLRNSVMSGIMKNQMQSASGGFSINAVERRNITTTLTGTGTLQPLDSYTVTANVSGDITGAFFEEMDEVPEDYVLYTVDSSDIESDIEDKREDVSDALEDYNDALEDKKDLDVISEFSGTVRELYVEEGDNISAGAKLAYIVDSDTMLLEIPFFASNTDHISNGNTATVTFSGTGEVLFGTVDEISHLTSVNSNNSTVRNITISVKNPGGITFGASAYASVVGNDGITYYCSGEGTFRYNEEELIIAEAGGEIEKLYIEEGDRVSEGSPVAMLYSENLEKQIEQLKKAYDQQMDALDDLIERYEDYTIKAPIAGTVVQKNYKELDTIGSSSLSSTTTLAIIYDMSKLTFDLNIDELDLGMISVGQQVKITSDSIDGAVYTGVVTKKSIVGSSSGGTTTYPVTVEIDETEGLLPGMNINAEIIISSAENVLTIPVSALKRGNKVEVIKNPDASAGVVPEKPETETVTVEVGSSDEDYVEIRSGLSEGDLVVYEIVNITQDAFTAMFGAMSGAMPGGMGGMGGMSSGGMGNRGDFSGNAGNRGNIGGGMSGGMPGGR